MHPVKPLYQLVEKVCFSSEKNHRRRETLRRQTSAGDL
jgi:hypothetical protein